eukprot:8675095-Alexandrium_andersonii.AAC.1
MDNAYPVEEGGASSSAVPAADSAGGEAGPSPVSSLPFKPFVPLEDELLEKVLDACTNRPEDRRWREEGPPLRQRLL